MASRMAPWHLRQFHRRASSHRVGNESDGTKKHENTLLSLGKDTQSAHAIFSKAPSDYFECSQNGGFIVQDGKTVTGKIDGDEVVFELREDVSQKPTTDRTQRFDDRNFKSINNEPSRWDIRGLWFIEEDKCCGDPDMSFLEVFDYAVQTSFTIGYGGYVPQGIWSNFLVVLISLFAIMQIGIYTGLLYFKFSCPVAKIQFSDVMTLSNVNGLPCIELRVGNCDGSRNNLIDVSARMTYQYTIKYMDEKGHERMFAQTEELMLLADRRFELREVVWTLRHVVDEHSPLYGLDLLEPPGSNIVQFDVCINATQKITGAPVFAHTGYEIVDVMIGHRFVDQIEYDRVTRSGFCDYAKMDDTVPHPVWYPTARRQAK
ncbi:K channel, inward rectifier [Seminavis robusta]|uniref:K channel, inward rectifier n=1 Tax=Seminavis robusta TaxID=568900 RepID=A0A9N8DUV7_9STRA|nr:K channel, inward rectifier [Seminavis robusta]|eukprot:Sro293_g110040.1 K channel, inward rectifier (374) ;mRNA; r:63783-65070